MVNPVNLCTPPYFILLDKMTRVAGTLERRVDCEQRFSFMPFIPNPTPLLCSLSKYNSIRLLYRMFIDHEYP